MAESIVPFVDFDDQIEFDNAFSKAKAQSTRNFVIDFNVDQAKCAFDLDEVEIESLLEPRTHNPPSSQPASYSTRWIHIWRPEDQKHTIEAVAKHYGFSPRLTLSMTADPMKPQPVSNTLSRSSSRYRDLLRPNRSKRSLVKNKNSEKSIISDLESKDQLGSEAILSALDLSHYRIVNELWHFMSVDWGHKCRSFRNRLI